MTLQPAFSRHFCSPERRLQSPFAEREMKLSVSAAQEREAGAFIDKISLMTGALLPPQRGPPLAVAACPTFSRIFYSTEDPHPTVCIPGTCRGPERAVLCFLFLLNLSRVLGQRASRLSQLVVPVGYCGLMVDGEKK